VFTDQPYLGNPLAVVVDGDGLDTLEMQRFASWTNLSETTFLLPPTDPEADYLVRIFTPVAELPFAGHPTLGSASAWLAHGGVPRRDDVVVQQCGVGLVPIRRDGAGLTFAAPALLRGGPVDEATICQAVAELGIERDQVIDAAWVDNGPGWLGLLLPSADDVLAVRPGVMRLTVGIAGLYPPGSPHAYEVRALYSDNGFTIEDPVTGSLNASLAQWLIAADRVTPPYTASQGTVLGRAGRVRVSTDETGQVWVGGDVVTCVTGTVEL
jgi:PhzF family phenazine biosynthesis protein